MQELAATGPEDFGTMGGMRAELFWIAGVLPGRLALSETFKPRSAAASVLAYDDDDARAGDEGHGEEDPEWPRHSTTGAEVSETRGPRQRAAGCRCVTPGAKPWQPPRKRSRRCERSASRYPTPARVITSGRQPSS